MATVDSLDIKISAQAKSASDSIDKLVGKLDTLSRSLGSISGSNLSGLANGVNKLATATNQLKGVKASEFTRIANGFKKFADIDASKLSTVAGGLNTLSRGLNAIGNVSNLQSITPTINAIKNLAKVDMSGFDTGKMNTIASTISSFAGQLSTVGSIDSNIVRLVSAIARLSGTGQYIGNVSTELPKLGTHIVTLVKDLSKAGTIDISIAKVVDAIARLASAGKTIGTTVANLDKLGDGVLRLLQKLQSAPTINANIANTVQGLGNLASSGSRISTVSVGASNSTNLFGNALGKLKDRLSSAHKSSKGLLSSIGMFYAKCFLLIRVVKKLGSSIGSAQDYIENFNYFSVALTKIGNDAKDSFAEYGYDSAEEYAESFKSRFATLQKQMTGYTVDTDTGELTSSMSHNLGLDISQVMNYQGAIAQITNSSGMLAETSINTSKALSMLAADWSSLANEDLSTVMDNLQSGLIGQSRAVYKYGIDITQASLAQVALNHGVKESVSNLSNQSKEQLRTLAMLEQSKVAYGDLARTINQPANQLRMLEAGFLNLCRTIGQIFLPIIQKIYPYLNAVVMVLQDFAKWIAKLTGAKLSDDTSVNLPDYSDTADDIDDVADATDNASKSQKKYNDNLQGFDIVNKLSDNSTSSSSSSDSSSGTSDIDLSGDIANALANYQSIWDKAFNDNKNKAVQLAKKIKKALLGAWAKGDFTKLGKKLAKWINNGLKNIPWGKIKKTLKKLAKSIATFLNGFVSGLNWKLIGKTLAEGINTIIGAGYEFLTTFDWVEFGTSLADGINSFIDDLDTDTLGATLGAGLRAVIDTAFGFVENFNFKGLGTKISDGINAYFTEMGKVNKKTGLTGWQEMGKTISDTITGLEDTIITALKNIDWDGIGKAVGQFLGSIEWENIIGKLIEAVATAIKGLFKLAISAIKEDPSGVLKALTALFGVIFAVKKIKSIINIFKPNLTTQIANGISSALGGVKTKGKIGTATKNLGTKIANKISAVFTGTTFSSTISTALESVLGTAISTSILVAMALISDKLIASSGISKSHQVSDLDVLTQGIKDLLSGTTSKKTKYYLYVAEQERNNQEALSFKEWKKQFKTTPQEKAVASAEEAFSKMDKSGLKVLKTTKGVITSTEKYKKAVKALSSKMSDLNIPSKKQKEIQETLKKKLDNGVITWKEYKKIVNGNYTSIKDLKSAISGIKDKSAKVSVTTDGKDDVDSVKSSVDDIPTNKDTMVSVKVDNASVNTAKASVNSLPSKKDVKVTATASIDKKAITEDLQNATSGMGKMSLKATVTATKLVNGKEVKAQLKEYSTGLKVMKIMLPSSMKQKTAIEQLPWAKELQKHSMIEFYATGGFPDKGQMFVANEKGAELVGNMNGRTTVANQGEIAQGFADSITKTLAPVMYSAFKQAATETAQTSGGDVYLDGKKITENVINHVNTISKSRGNSPLWGVS